MKLYKRSIVRTTWLIAGFLPDIWAFPDQFLIEFSKRDMEFLSRLIDYLARGPRGMQRMVIEKWLEAQGLARGAASALITRAWQFGLLDPCNRRANGSFIRWVRTNDRTRRGNRGARLRRSRALEQQTLN